MSIEEKHVLQPSQPIADARQDGETDGVGAIPNRTDENMMMRPDPNSNQNALYGIIADASTNLPIDNATVELFRVQGAEALSEGIIATNAEGHYLFADLPPGQYWIAVKKFGFFPAESDPIHLSARERASANIGLTVDEDAAAGSVSGIIKDKASGAPLADAIVALYELTDSIETLMLITRTNADGLYVFGNLPQGRYKVKATVHAVSE